MKKISRKIHSLISYFFVVSGVNWIKFFRYYDKYSENIVWMAPRGRNKLREYLGTEYLLKDLTIISALIKLGKGFRIVTGSQINEIRNKRIFYTVSRLLIPSKVRNDIEAINDRIKSLEMADNTLYPDSEELRYWENKAYMHRMFTKLQINHPKTVIYKKGSPLPEDLKFPLLIKEIHSAGAVGVHKVNCLQELIELLENLLDSETDEILLQDLINMRKDLRVTLIGNEIVLFYWRINGSKEWKPTSTSLGSTVDFDFFPKQWEGYIINTFNKLNISNGAFDITWDNDDLNTTPLFLEVSPVYKPNPRQPTKYANLSYSEWKKKYFIKESYIRTYINLSYDLKHIQIKYYFNTLVQKP